MKPALSLFISFLAISSACGLASAQGRVVFSVRLVTDEAEAVLSILSKRKANELVTDADWQRVFQSEGYTRLKKREASMRRPFEDADFKTFVLSQSLAEREPALQQTLTRWKRADFSRAAGMALAYLPKEARIIAKIYPVIKPQENSFVFEVKDDAAIFLYLDPTVSQAKFENTLAHELHHIGYGSTCPSQGVQAELSKLSPNEQKAFEWAGAFGEGFAMLAAAGGPDIHPHAVGSREERARWDKEVANIDANVEKLQKFFGEVIKGKLTDDQIQQAGFSFFGTQGPWYTVGWRMAVLIEKTYGRAKLIECMCDPRKLFSTYNEAAVQFNRKASKRLPLWY
jgi:hypothetical protein